MREGKKEGRDKRKRRKRGKKGGGGGSGEEKENVGRRRKREKEHARKFIYRNNSCKLPKSGEGNADLGGPMNLRIGKSKKSTQELIIK